MISHAAGSWSIVALIIDTVLVLAVGVVAVINIYYCYRKRQTAHNSRQSGAVYDDVIHHDPQTEANSAYICLQPSTEGPENITQNPVTAEENTSYEHVVHVQSL